LALLERLLGSIDDDRKELTRIFILNPGSENKTLLKERISDLSDEKKMVLTMVERLIAPAATGSFFVVFYETFVFLRTSPHGCLLSQFVLL
jgi:hypothetical protein